MYDLEISRQTMGSDRQADLGASTGIDPPSPTCDQRRDDRAHDVWIAYVIIPTEFESLQAALDEALAPFRRGGPDEFPREALAFDDVTGELRQLHRLPITLEAKAAGVALRSEDSASADDF